MERSGVKARLSAVPVIRDDVDVMSLQLTPQDAFVISRIDGRTSVEELVSMTGLGREQTLEIMETLLDQEFISLVDFPSSSTLSERRTGEHRQEARDEDTGPVEESAGKLIPTSQQAYRFFQGAMEEKANGNINAARINLKLAIQYDPDNRTYFEELKTLEKEERKKRSSSEHRPTAQPASSQPEAPPRRPQDIQTVERKITPVLTGNLTAGTMVEGYQIESIIDEGGMGVIYKGMHPMIGKHVAIKVLRRRLAENPDAIRRFVMEARSVNEIGHFNIVDIFSFGTLDDGRTYLVMEYLRGLNIHDLLTISGAMPPGKVLPIFEQLCSTMHVIHDKGFVHRDLKPLNIFILKQPPHPFVKVLDFGLAKLWSNPSVSTVTEAGVILGTPGYMSPEQCLGEDVDYRTDIYSMGVLLYQMVTGDLPFNASSFVEMVSSHVLKQPRSPSSLADISPSLEWVILKALAKIPEERFDSAEEMLEGIKLAIPDRLVWQSHLDAKAPTPDPGSGLIEVNTGPLVLPPNELTLSPEEVEPGQDLRSEEEELDKDEITIVSGEPPRVKGVDCFGETMCGAPVEKANLEKLATRPIQGEDGALDDEDCSDS